MRLVLGAVLVGVLVVSLSARATHSRAVPGATFSTLKQGGTQIDVVTLDLSTVELHLLWKDPQGVPLASLREGAALLETQRRAPVVLMNAGIYGKDLAPLGLHVENGKVLRPLNRGRGGGNFYLRANGVFFIREGRAAVLSTEQFHSAVGRDPVQLATQSGPLLVENGGINGNFKAGSDKRTTRNGVGVRKDGTVVLAISRGPINMHDFATIFRDGLLCPDALYLDGTISAFHAPAAGLPVAWSDDGRFVGMLAATERRR